MHSGSRRRSSSSNRKRRRRRRSCCSSCCCCCCSSSRESVRFDALASHWDYFMTAGAADMLRSALTTVNIFLRFLFFVYLSYPTTHTTAAERRGEKHCRRRGHCTFINCSSSSCSCWCWCCTSSTSSTIRSTITVHSGSRSRSRVHPMTAVAADMLRSALTTVIYFAFSVY